MLKKTSFTFGATLVLAACGESNEPTGSTPGAAVEKISATQAALMVASNTEAALMGLTNAGAFLVESSAVASTMTELGGGSSECLTTAVTCSASDPSCLPSQEEVCEPSEVTQEDLEEAHADLQEGIAELVTELQTKLFNEANVESADDRVVTFLLGPEELCSQVTSASDSAAGPTIVEEGYDPECVEQVTRAEVRLRVTSPSEGNVDVTVQIAKQRFEPLVFELHQDRLALTVDLDQTMASIEAVGEDVGGLETLAGRWQFELVKNAELDFSARFNVLEDLRVVGDADGHRIEASLGKSSPTTEARIDGNAKTITATYDYGPMRLAGPLAAFADMFDSDGDSVAEAGGIAAEAPAPEPEPVYTGTIEAVLAGLDGSFSFDGRDDSFSLRGLGLGDQSTTLKHDGKSLLELDVNEDAGRHFDLTVQDTASGLEFTFSPTLDLSLLLQFQHVADQFDVPTGLLDDHLRVFFDGANPSVRVRDGGLEVTSGTLHLSSTAHPETNLDVAEGMCLLGGTDEAPVASASDAAPEVTAQPVEPEEETEEPAFAGLVVGTCE